ncbi:MAG: DUF86 domain-containing protein [Ignavibacteria bacterium]|nr:DUF86 domain-containing protein [Ignavibacteria bacterium]
MNSKERRYDLFLEDILNSINLIEEYIGELEFKEFKQSRMVVDAVIRNFEIIGEAAKNIPPDIQIKYPEIPWKKMYNLRNLISHVYFGIDYEMIWEIVKRNLPLNKIDIIKIIEKEKHT